MNIRKGVFKKMKKKYYFVILFLVLAIFLSGCSGVVTPSSDGVVCKNLLKGFYTALSNQNFTQALSYCKSGGITFDYVNNLWNIAQQYPTLYVTYQVYDIYDLSYVGKYLSLYHDYSWTQHSIYGGINNTTYKYGSLKLFEKVNGQWKLS
ncbi:hypothetical protein CVT91_07545 [Candidatus Atribacteria bacterium HGW-Atribacteria-1]|nr:MAG: hypothetical protein CVT91_07545 [Candidatus Atribacteria bacterium HGW-Atribacteria-1]